MKINIGKQIRAVVGGRLAKAKNLQKQREQVGGGMFDSRQYTGTMSLMIDEQCMVRDVRTVRQEAAA